MGVKIATKVKKFRDNAPALDPRDPECQKATFLPEGRNKLLQQVLSNYLEHGGMQRGIGGYNLLAKKIVTATL
jgi:hypothetical protein